MKAFRFNVLLCCLFMASDAIRIAHAIDVVVNVAGTGAPGFSGDGGPATSAKLNSPGGMTEDSAGNIYFCDTNNNCVRRVDAVTQNITTIAGTGASGFSGDNGPATAAQFHSPVSLVFDQAGNLYISDQGNNRIRKVNTGGIVTTFAGNGSGGFGGDNGPATAANVFTPATIAIDPVTTNGNHAVVFSQLNTSVIRRVDPATNIITSICGNGSNGFGGDNGPAKSAQLDEPAGICYDAAGNLYIPDTNNERLRKITRSSGIIATIAGTGAKGFAGDNGPALSAKFFLDNSPTIGGVASLDAAGNIFLTDTFNQRIRHIDVATGIITTIAGSGTAGYNGDVVDALSAQFNVPEAVFVEPNGNYLISDSSNSLIRRVVRNAQFLPFSVTSIIPNSGGDTGVTTPTIIGSGFQNNATVILRRSGSADIVGTAVRNRNGLGLQATFDLTGQTDGAYDVIVTNPGGASRTLTKGFTVVAGAAAQLAVDIIGNDVIRGGKEQAYFVVCSNSGSNDQFAVPLIVEFPSFLQFNPGFTVTHPTLQASGVPPLDFTKIPLVVPGKDESKIQLLIPFIPAGGVKALSFRFTVPDTKTYAHVHFNFEATIGQPLMPSTLQAQMQPARQTGNGARAALIPNACQRNAINTLFACAGIFLPGLTCEEQILSFTFQTIYDTTVLINDPTSTKQDSVSNLGDILQNGGQVAASCLKGAIPIYGQYLNAVQCTFGIATAINCGNPPNNAQKNATSIVSGDPNNKSGPAGPGDAHYIAPGTPMTYFIQFENKPDATAAAQTVIITDALDTTVVDPATISLGVMTFADTIITPPPGLSSYTADVDLRPAKNLIARVTAGLQGSTLRWEFDSLDPVTMMPTTDPVLGFLDPNVKPPQGEAGVLFTIQQKPNLAIGTVISNQATIVFDANSPIDTPVWSNTLALLGLDTDGDGFPDELEIAAGSNPSNPNNTPLGPGTFTLQALTVSKLQVKLDFTGKKSDSLMLSGSFPALPAGFVLNGQVAQIFVGGIYAKFTLDDKGESPKSKTASFVVKQAKNVSQFSAKVSGKFAAKLLDKGFDGSQDLKAPKLANRSVQVYVLFNKGFYGEKAPVSFGSKLNTSGSLKLAP